jgi:sugar-specific transcriptional regulator TrmB
MSTMLTDTLQQYGFSEREAKVYLAALELGVAPASSIARRVGENRVTTYSVLKVLKKRGMIVETQKRNTTRYAAESPEILLSHLEQKAT